MITFLPLFLLALMFWAGLWKATGWLCDRLFGKDD